MCNHNMLRHHTTDVIVGDEKLPRVNLCALAQVTARYEDSKSTAGSSWKAVVRVYINNKDVWPKEWRDKIFGIGNGDNCAVAGYIVDGRSLNEGDEVMIYWCVFDGEDGQDVIYRHVFRSFKLHHRAENKKIREIKSKQTPPTTVKQRVKRISNVTYRLAKQKGFSKLSGGERLSILLKAMFPNQADASRKLSVSLRTIRSHCNGKFRPDCDTVEALCLWGGTESPRTFVTR